MPRKWVFLPNIFYLNSQAPTLNYETSTSVLIRGNAALTRVQRMVVAYSQDEPGSGIPTFIAKGRPWVYEVQLRAWATVATQNDLADLCYFSFPPFGSGWLLTWNGYTFDFEVSFWNTPGGDYIAAADSNTWPRQRMNNETSAWKYFNLTRAATYHEYYGVDELSSFLVRYRDESGTSITPSMTLVSDQGTVAAQLPSMRVVTGHRPMRRRRNGLNRIGSYSVF